LREHAGLSGDDVAERLGWSGSKVSRIETHRTGIKASDLDLLLNLYDVDDGQRDKLRALANEQDARGWWSVYASSLPAGYLAYIRLEAAAQSIYCWSPELIHGLLQTEDYAGAVIRTALGDPARVPPGEIQRMIEARLQRQTMLNARNSKQFSFVLDEAALRHRLGTPAIMRAQMLHLERMSRLPNVAIQVLAFSGPYAIGAGGFALLEFSRVHGLKPSDAVYIEHLTGNSFVEDETEAHEYRLAYGRLAQEALDEDASRKLIRRIAREVWT
jgi:transcriptional regulator with XRE-family HTH domain